MNTSDINDAEFKKAVDAIDAGRITELKDLIDRYPRLIKERLINSEEGYFKDPYLIYFIADNPIRNKKLAANILDITRLLIGEIKSKAKETWQEQINYTLGLVVTGRIPKECGMQIELTDLLIDEGAEQGTVLSALAHGNMEAAAHLINRGAPLNLAAGAGLDYSKEDIAKLLVSANENEKLIALTVAAFYGNYEMVSFLLSKGINPNGYPSNNEGFHSHATPLHQAVSSGSLEAVKLLVEAGASLNSKDKIYEGTPLGWATYMQAETNDEEMKIKYKEIENYLQNK